MKWKKMNQNQIQQNDSKYTDEIYLSLKKLTNFKVKQMKKRVGGS